MIGRRGERISGWSLGASFLAQIFFRAPSAKEADNGGAAGLVPARKLEWEKDEEKALVGGRRGECAAVLSDNGPGTELRALKDADSGDGREGDEAKALRGFGDRANPGEVPPIGPDEGGPKGSRRGEDPAIRCTGGDWREEESADRIGTGLDTESDEALGPR